MRVACQAVNVDMISEFMARNARSLRQLEEDPNVEIRAFPAAVLDGLERYTLEVIEDLAAADPMVERVWRSHRSFQNDSRGWQRISEQAYLNTR